MTSVVAKPLCNRPRYHLRLEYVCHATNSIGHVVKPINILPVVQLKLLIMKATIFYEESSNLKRNDVNVYYTKVK